MKQVGLGEQDIVRSESLKIIDALGINVTTEQLHKGYDGVLRFPQMLL